MCCFFKFLSLWVFFLCNYESDIKNEICNLFFIYYSICNLKNICWFKKNREGNFPFSLDTLYLVMASFDQTILFTPLQATACLFYSYIFNMLSDPKYVSAAYLTNPIFCKDDLVWYVLSIFWKVGAVSINTLLAD